LSGRITVYEEVLQKYKKEKEEKKGINIISDASNEFNFDELAKEKTLVKNKINF